VLVAPFALGAPRPVAQRARFARWPQLFAERLPLGRLLRGDVALAFGIAGPGVLLGSIVIAVLALVLPPIAISRAIAPLAWIWPLGAIAATSVADARANLDALLLTTPAGVRRRVLARWCACFALALLPISALALRDGPAGIALIAIAAAIVGLGLALGTVTRSAAGFSALMMIAWYLGPVNGVAVLDPAAAVATPASATAIALGVAALALAVTTRRLAHRV
jgi:hypothetical protein